MISFNEKTNTVQFYTVFVSYRNGLNGALQDSNNQVTNLFLVDDLLVTTHTMSVSPAETSSNSIITPPPPDVINHSDPSNSAAQDTTDDFPSPPPDLLTQTGGKSSHPPQVETHTVVIGGDGTTKEDFERMISHESVTTSETTITKTMVSNDK